MGERRRILVVASAALVLVAGGILLLVVIKGGSKREVIETPGAGPSDSSTPRSSPFQQPTRDGTAGEKGASTTPSNAEGGGASATVEDQRKPDEETGGVLKGRVINIKEEPVAGARVVLTGEFDLKSLKMEKYQVLPIIFRKVAFPDKTLAETCTDEMGKFAFFTGEVDDGVYCLRASSAGFATGIKHEVKVKAGLEGKPIVVVLGPAVPLSGRVVDPSKVPVEGVRVSAIPMKGKSHGWAESAKDGTFRIERLLQGKYKIAAGRSGKFAGCIIENVQAGAVDVRIVMKKKEK